jgi:hypothetical protein
MKKTIILMIVAVAAIINTSCAQDNPGSTQDNQTDMRTRLMFGVKAGFNYSNVYDTKGEAFNADGKFGFATGGFIAIPIGRLFGLQPEILFSQKGFRGTGILLGSTYDFTRTTNYLDIPLLVSFKPSEFITILAGPQYSYLLKQKDVFANATTSIEQEQVFENDNIRNNTLCFTGGLVFTLKHMLVGARAGWDILNNNGDGTSTTPRYKNVWYQFTIGYRFYNIRPAPVF